MKNSKIIRWISIIGLIIAINMISMIVNYVFPDRYYPDVEAAVRSQSRNHRKLATITGEEGVVYITLNTGSSNVTGFGIYNFHTKEHRWQRILQSCR